MTVAKTPLTKYTRTFDTARQLLQLLGCWEFKDEKLYQRIFRFISRWSHWSVMTMGLLSIFADCATDITNMTKVADGFGFLVPLLLSFVKNIICHNRRNEIRDLLDRVNGPVYKLTFSSDLGVVIRLRDAMAYLTLDYRMFKYFLLAAMSMFYLSMIFVADQLLPFPGLFPFDPAKSPWFQIAFTIQTWSLILGLVWLWASDMLMLVVLRWMNVQLKILRNNYECCNVRMYPRSNFNMSEENLDIVKNYNYFTMEDKYREIKSYVPFNEDEADVKDDSFVLRFKTCIHHHQRLYGIIDDFNSIFSNILFIEIFSNCTLGCMNLFLISENLDNPPICIKYVITVVSGLTHMGYLCVFGNMVSNQTNKLLESIWNSGWVDEQSMEIKNLLLNNQLKSLAPKIIEAGKFFNLTLPTLLWVLQKAYAFFAFLNTAK